MADCEAVFVVCTGFRAGFSVVFCADFCAGFAAVEEAEPAGAVAEPPLVCPLVDCPAPGSTIINKESTPARQREARRETEVGEDKTLISSL